MPKATALLRVGRRRTMIAPVDPAPPTKPQDEADEVFGSSSDERQEFVDPAQIAASIMLAAALESAGLSIADVTAPGAISLAVVPDVFWVKHVRQAWAVDISGESNTGDGTQSHSYYKRPTTLIFAVAEEPKAIVRQDLEEGFEKAVARRVQIVGISPDPAWLPADMVTAADHQIRLMPLLPDGLVELALRVAGCAPTLTATAADAAAVTPRLARLAARPHQTGDDYMRKLATLIAADLEQTRSANTATRKLPGLRDAPSLDRLHGMDEAVAWGLQLRNDLAAYKAGQRAWADVDRGLLLSGPPGTGKTIFARALAASCEVTLVTGSYGSWLSTGSAHQGDLLRSMRNAFKDAKEAAPSILFIDEVDAFSDRARVKHFPEWHTEVVNTLLAEIDGVVDREGVVVVGACNHPNKLDPALVRSGRLDRHIGIRPPDRVAMASILREQLGTDVPELNLAGFGLLLLGSTGADAERLVRGARRRARNAGRPMREVDLVAEAGAEDRRSADDLRLCAVHEAGHAVAASALGLSVEGVTIRDSATQGGQVSTAVTSPFLTDEDVQNRLVALLSGRAAEEVLLGRITSGAGGRSGSDLQRATWLAASAAAELGLDPNHGLTWTPLPEQKDELSAVLAADARLAQLVRCRLAVAYDDALAVMRRSVVSVRAVADALLEQGALDGADVRHIANAHDGQSQSF